MKSPEVVRQAFALHEAGMIRREIAEELGIAMSTLSRWLQAGEVSTISTFRMDHTGGLCPAECPRKANLDVLAYAYLLGQYLGDGWIGAEQRGVYRLSISCCATYPGIVEECSGAMRSVMPGGSVVRQLRSGVRLLSIYSKHWPCLFPQHGPGPKHLRPIVLEGWQRTIALEAHPERFVRGLVHSDGWRGINNVRGANGQPYAYSRYQFTNHSLQIQQLFVDACVALGVECRQMNRWNISVNTRKSVALLDRHVGPKF
jgi:hypothetical protein